jgi:hypothetical protein
MTRAWAIRLLAAAAAIGLSVTVATADEGATTFSATLSGFQEVLPAVAGGPTGDIFSNATGSFHATIHGATLTYTETFSGFTTAVTQSHIHFAQRGVNGGVFLFLCSNLGNGPAGTPACTPGTRITRTVSAADFLGITGQAFPAANFQAAVRVLRSGDAYVNVHTTQFPAGEIRGQVHFGDDR